MMSSLARNASMLISLVLITFAGLFWAFLRLFSLETYKFVLTGDLTSINNQILFGLVKVNLVFWIIYLVIILLGAFLIFIKKGKIRVLLLAIVVLTSLISTLEVYSVFSEANTLKNKLKLVSYPGVQEYKFDSFNGYISSNYKRINFTVKGKIDEVFNYYKNNLPQGTKLENPEEKVTVDLISDGQTTTESNFATAQLRIDIINTNSLPDYSVSFTSEKGSSSTQISVQ